jgi:hypothetical protein
MLWCDVFGLLRSGRRDDADRRTFQPRCYGPAHTGTDVIGLCRRRSLVRPQAYAPGSYKGLFHLRQLCVNSAEAF